MFYIVTSSSDTYITNKIIDSDFRAEDANVGRAGTLDLFKLYDESVYMSGSTKITSSVREISRLLVKFDYETISLLSSSSLDFTDPSFRAMLELEEVSSGLPVPRDFWVVSHPLAMSFSEGSGRDVNRFMDIDVANFLTSSYLSNTAVLWNLSGSEKSGVLGEANVDYYLSGTIGTSNIDFGSSQYFEDGTGKISLNVTSVVSSSLANIIPNHGFRISFSGSYETDTKTRFVKRFASRHTRNKMITPKLTLTWNNAITDAYRDFVFNTSASLYLQNTVGGIPTSLYSGSSLSPLVGENCILLSLVSGSGNTQQTIYVTASQHTGSSTGAGTTGVYKASFLLNQFSSMFSSTTAKADEVKLISYWSSIDKTIGYKTGSLTVKKSSVASNNFVNRKLLFTATNALPEYRKYSRVKIRIFIEDITAQLKAKSYKLPRELQTITVAKAYYRIRDVITNNIIIPFDDVRNATLLSTDETGMYIDFLTAGLPLGRNYTIDLLVKDNGLSEVVELNSISFRIIS